MGKWIVAGLVAVIVLLVVIAVTGSLLSLDWQRSHSAATRALPVFTGFGDGAPALVRIPARGMEFRARIAGSRGPGVILLHGFPVTSAMWDPLLPAAADGYRIVAFDQRGYSPGARPEGAAAYAAPELVADVLAVADAVGFERFHLVGHDWGSVAGWGLVLRAPERVLSWSALSIPHPTAFLSALADDPDQKQRSGYFRFFGTPWLPELFFTWNGLAVMRSGIYAPMTPAQREEYLQVFAEPGALTAALDWYRAIGLSRQSAGDVSPLVTVPTLFLWGTRDPAVSRSPVEAQRAYMKGPFREVELDADHWVMEEQGPRAIEEIRAHWRRSDPQAPPDPHG
ncbi:MAG TPA: alpha/beta fold hydrolase [Candidatus Binatia bacterium]|nr:alpha/beta fold hydrolase [Candidatus Binatia bacterium]